MDAILKTIYQTRYLQLVDALINARKQAGLTQIQVATQLSKPQSYIAKVEGSDRKLDVVEFVALCEVIGQDPCELIKQLQQS